MSPNNAAKSKMLVGLFVVDYSLEYPNLPVRDVRRNAIHLDVAGIDL